MTFKEQMQQDINNIFANTDEYFEWRHVANTPRPGKMMRVMEDEYELLEREKYSSERPGASTPRKTRRLLYIPVEDFGKKPAAETILTLDETRQFRILECAIEVGFYVITVEAMRR